MVGENLKVIHGEYNILQPYKVAPKVFNPIGLCRRFTENFIMKRYLYIDYILGVLYGKE